MDKEEARRRGYGPPWDVMFTDEESDQSFGNVPEVSEGLLEKTMKKCQRAAHFEVERFADPERIDFKLTMQRWTGKPYDNPNPSLSERVLAKVLHAFGYRGEYRPYREVRKNR